MTDDTKKRMEERLKGPKPLCRDCADENGLCPSNKTPCDRDNNKYWEAGYTAAHTDAQGEIARLQDKIHTERKILNEQHSVLMAVRDTEIEKLKAENSKLKENIQWLELDIKDMRELYLSNDSKLTLERAASAELIAMVNKMDCECGYDHEAEVTSPPLCYRCEILAAHHARQKERG